VRRPGPYLRWDGRGPSWRSGSGRRRGRWSKLVRATPDRYTSPVGSVVAELETRAAGSRAKTWAVGFVMLAAACLGNRQPDESEISGRWEPTPETLELVKSYRQFTMSNSWIALGPGDQFATHDVPDPLRGGPFNHPLGLPASLSGYWKLEQHESSGGKVWVVSLRQRDHEWPFGYLIVRNEGRRHLLVLVITSGDGQHTTDLVFQRAGSISSS